MADKNGTVVEADVIELGFHGQIGLYWMTTAMVSHWAPSTKPLLA